MKHLLVIVLVLASSLWIFSQAQTNVTKTNLPESVSYQNILNLSALGNQDVVTRSNSIALNLDTLQFTTDKEGDYFISLRIKLYTWKDNAVSKPEPARELGFLFKETIKTNNKVATLANLNLSSNQSLSDINFGEIEVKVVQEDSKSNVTDILNAFIKKAFASTDALNVVDMLLAKQQIPAEQLIFKSGFEIPLNSMEYQLRYQSKRDNVLINNQKIGISLDGTSKCALLRGSVLGNIVANFTKVFKAVAGTQEASAKLTHKGVMVLNFTTDKNSLLPKDIKDNLTSIYAALSASKFEEAHTSVDFTRQVILNYYKGSNGEENQRIYYNALKYLTLAEIYIDYQDPKRNVKKNNDAFEDLYDHFSDLYTDLTLQQMNIGFLLVKTDGIYDGASTNIFLPYSLDEVSMRNFLMWQVKLHQQIKKKEKALWLKS